MLEDVAVVLLLKEDLRSGLVSTVRNLPPAPAFSLSSAACARLRMLRGLVCSRGISTMQKGSSASSSTPPWTCIGSPN